MFFFGYLNRDGLVVIQFLSNVVPLAEMDLPHSLCNYLHSVLPLVSSQGILLHETNLLCLLLQVFFGRPCFLSPVTSRFRATLKTLSSSLPNTCSYHLTPFAVANRSIVSFNPNMSIYSSIVFLLVPKQNVLYFK